MRAYGVVTLRCQAHLECSVACSDEAGGDIIPKWGGRMFVLSHPTLRRVSLQIQITSRMQLAVTNIIWVD
jgi:hypothetical protein